MRIDEFAKKEDFKLPFDIADDVAIYMRNDPMVYRKSLFPAIMRMKDLHDAGKTVNPKECLSAAVHDAMPRYCKKFKLGSPENVFRKGDDESIINKLFSEEMKMIKDGAY
jgi:hypothetical protein